MGVGGVCGVVEGLDVGGVGDVVEDVVGDVVVAVGRGGGGLVEVAAEGPRMTVMCWPGVRGGDEFDGGRWRVSMKRRR